MNKKLVLVGMESREKAIEYARELMRNLREGDGIPVSLTCTAFCFETPHVEVRFIHDPRNQVLDGMRADAIYGIEEYKAPLMQYAKSTCLKVNRVGLREYIVCCERAYAEEQRKKDEWEEYASKDNATTRLAALQAAAIKSFARAISSSMPKIERVHFSGPVTCVIWSDKTKTIVRCGENDTVDYEKGLAMAIAKRVLGTNETYSNYYEVFKKYLPKPEVDEKAEFLNKNLHMPAKEVPADEE